jgi:small conductance mechanosensitive channel
VLKIPFTLGIVGLVTYVAIRFSYVLIDRFTAALAINTLLTPEDSLRLQLRVSTISGVIKALPL